MDPDVYAGARQVAFVQTYAHRPTLFTDVPLINIVNHVKLKNDTMWYVLKNGAAKLFGKAMCGV